MRRSTLCFTLLLLTFATVASAGTYTVTLNNGTSFVTRYEPEEVASFGTQARRAWQSSLQSMAEAGQRFLIGIVFVGPWLVVLLILGAVALLCLRFVWRRVFRRDRS